MTDSAVEELSKAKALLQEGNYGKSLDVIQSLLDGKKFDNPLMTLELLILKAEVCWRSGLLDEGFETIKVAEEIFNSLEMKPEQEELETHRLKASFFSQAGIIHWYRGELEKAEMYHRQCLELNNILGDKDGISKALNNLGLVFWSKGNLEKAVEYYHRSLSICQEADDEQAMARVLNNLANISASQGELDQALEFHRRSLSIKERIASKQDVAMSLINIGVTYRLKGDLNQAKEYYNRSLAIQNDLSIGPEFALAMNNLGEIFNLQGELDTALDFYQRSLLIYENMGNMEGIALSLTNIGDINSRRGSPEIALEYYQRSLTISEDIGNAHLISTILTELVKLALEDNNSVAARDYLSKLEQVTSESDSKVVSQHYRLSNALILKKSGRVRDRVKAEDIFEQIIEEGMTDQTVTAEAMIHLCDLLLIELKATGEEEILVKVKGLTQQLVSIAQEQASHPLIVETYLLQSKLAVVAFEFKQGKELMERAKELADEKGLYKLAQIVDNEIKILQHQQKQWETVLEKSPSKQEMVDLTNLNELLERMVQKTVETLGIESATKQIQPKYELIHQDSFADVSKTEKSRFIVGIAQVGLSQGGDILNELYEEKVNGLIGLRDESIELTRTKIKEMISKAHSEGVNILIFPEMSIDLGYKQLLDDVKELARLYEMIIIPGSFHDLESKGNLCRVIGPNGILWEQEKHIPAIIHIDGKRFIEKIESSTGYKKTIICGTEYGRIAITICRDFLDMDLRVELKNSEPPVDLIINPAFTPVTADFKAAHFDARRSIYAYCFFANIAEFGDSLIYTPEKERIERALPAGEEGLILKDVDLFQLRSERKKWEKHQLSQKSFIQSTRT